VNPFLLLEQQWWLGLPVAFGLGAALGGSPLALPVLGAGVGLGTAVSARDGSPAYGPVAAFAGGLAVVYAALGFVADRIDLVFERTLSRTGGIAATVLAIVLIGVAIAIIVRPRADGLACRTRGRLGSTAGRVGSTRTGAFLAGIPAGILGCPACSGVIIGVAGSAALVGSTVYSVAAMTALGLGHGAAVLGVFWMVQRGWDVAALTSPRAQRLTALPLLLVGAWLLYLAAGLGLSLDARLP
jgi:cytochrome c-type biogenesis protein